MAKTILEKLGYKPGTAALVVGRPPALQPVFAEAEAAGGPDPAWLLFFVPNQAEVTRVAPQLSAAYRRGGHLWMAYPKKSGGLATDLTRDTGWAPVAAVGLMPVAQIAIDPVWSALRFRYRAEIPKLTRKGAASTLVSP